MEILKVKNETKQRKFNEETGKWEVIPSIFEMEVVNEKKDNKPNCENKPTKEEVKVEEEPKKETTETTEQSNNQEIPVNETK